MIINIILVIFLTSYSNLIIYKCLKHTKAINTIKEYFKYDENSIVFINLLMIMFSILLIIINYMIKN